MKRLENWPTLLADYFSSRYDAPFVWGVNDCCLFAADGVLAITGTDIAAAYRGKYDSAIGALKILADYDGSVIAIIDKHVKLPRTTLALARRGDLVAFEQEGEMALGICCGDRSAFPGKRGLTFRPTLKCKVAWKI